MHTTPRAIIWASCSDCQDDHQSVTVAATMETYCAYLQNPDDIIAAAETVDAIIDSRAMADIEAMA